MGFAGTVAAMLGHRVTFADIETPALLFARLNSIAYRDRVRIRRIDWKRDRLGEKFDLILGADVLYDREQWEHLEPFWRAHLCTAGVVLLGEPGRQTGEMFDDWIRSRGWLMERSEQRVSTRELPIRLFRIAPRASD
jgi:predicted nicotinamide N-methyase